MIGLLIGLALAALVSLYLGFCVTWLAGGRRCPMVGLPDRATLWLLSADDREVWALVRADER
ncbi:MAG TPA: hypothetical protein VGN19_05700 [Pedococcus sp.]|jgi:hypothetical protein|nr:hypothetical protein [Pedococcus sp.]